jgi:hypothetical protein
MVKLEYQILKSVDSNDNPIVLDSCYEDCQIAEFTGCWDAKDNYYEVLFFENKAYYLDELGNLFNDVETEDWQEDSNIYIYYDEVTDTYYEQDTNGNFWYEISKPILTNKE